MTSLSAKDWFEYKGDDLMWSPPPSAADISLGVLLESLLQRMYKTNFMVVPRLMIFLWRNQMGKEADLLFTVTVGMPF